MRTIGFRDDYVIRNEILPGLVALTIPTTCLLALFFFDKFELDLSSLLTNVCFSASLHDLQDQVNMVNLRTFASFAYLTQVAFAGDDVYTNSSQLRDIVPKRDVLYVGGQYTNVTASLNSH